MDEQSGRYWQDDLALIREAARQAGELAHSYFGQSPEVWWKNEGRSPVSAADFAANDRLLAMLMTARPDYGWLSEETDDNSDRLRRDTVFVVDPIDGTRAFINGDERWCVSVAVVHHGRPVAGVLAAPALGEEYCAVAGGVATKNGEAIRVTSVRGEQLVLAADEALVKRFEPPFRDEIHRVRHVPSLAYRLAMVADGRLDGTVVKRDSHDWDLAAADLILQQAGGALTDLSGNRVTYNREGVSHEMLVAGADHALHSLRPHLTA